MSLLKNFMQSKEKKMYKLHFGPGLNWSKPSSDWKSIDADSKRADIVINFNRFDKLPFDNNSISCIYGSHIFEHIDIFHAPLVFRECYRVLNNGGYFRIILPDVRKSIEEYIKGNSQFELFKRREESLKKLLNVKEVSLFETLKGDFISPNGQHKILGKQTLAHQNAWDFESIKLELSRAGFEKKEIKLMDFKKSNCDDFSFEGTYPSEANESYRSIYVEVKK